MKLSKQAKQSNTTITTTAPVIMRKRIGSTLYEVRGYFNSAATENAEEKLLRIMKNDLTNNSICATMELPQTVRLSEVDYPPERSSA